MNSKPRIIDAPGTLNFRDLGGYAGADGRTVCFGKVYRSAQLDRLEPKGVKVIRGLDIRTVLDLRFADETELYPTNSKAFPNAQILRWQDLEDLSAPTPSANKMRLSWRDSLGSRDPSKVREAMRVNYPTKLYSHRAIYQQMLRFLINDNTPLLFHCAAGKDRTGVAAALILALIGVDETQIMQDYLLTQELIEGRMETWLAGGATNSDKYQDFQSRLNEQPSEMLAPVLEADPSYMETLLSYVKETYGSFSNYAMQQLELSSHNIDTLKSRLLE